MRKFNENNPKYPKTNNTAEHELLGTTKMEQENEAPDTTVSMDVRYGYTPSQAADQKD